MKMSIYVLMNRHFVYSFQKFTIRKFPICQFFTKTNVSDKMGVAGGEDGVPDMTVISDIDEHGINKNLQKRYRRNKIYVSIQFNF